MLQSGHQNNLLLETASNSGAVTVSTQGIFIFFKLKQKEWQMQQKFQGRNYIFLSFKKHFFVYL